MGNVYFRLIATILCVLRLIQEYIEFSVSRDSSEYIYNIYNIMDLFGNGWFVAYNFFRTYYSENVEPMYASRVMLMMAVIFLGLKSLALMRIFGEYRVLVRLLKESFKDIVHFLVILLYVIFVFATAKLALYSKTKYQK